MKHTSIAFARSVIQISRLESSTLERFLWITSHGGNLGCELEGDGFVSSRRANRCRVLMLLEGGDFWIDRLNTRALVGGLANFGSVALQRSIDKSIGHALDVACCFSVGEGLICSGLLKTFHVDDLT